MAAQLNGTGFYRFRNVSTNNYISLANDKFSYQFLFGSGNDATFKCQQVGGGLSNLSSNTSVVKNDIFKAAEVFMKNDIHLESEPDCIDPSTILYLLSSGSGSGYDIIGQGTSLLNLTTGNYVASVRLIFKDIYTNISRSSGTGANVQYTASINISASDIENISYNDFLFALGKNSFLSQAKLGAYYFTDDNGSFSINSSNSPQNAKWYIEPVTHFNVMPEVEYGGKYYTTLYVPFAFKLSNNVEKAYTIKSISTDGTLEIEEVATNGGTVPAGAPVLLECSSNVASECQLIPVNVRPLCPVADATAQYAPVSSSECNYAGENVLKGSYFKNEDAPFDYNYNRSGTSTESKITLQNYKAPTNPQKYVVGITASGKLGFVKATGTAMPANKAWLEYTGTAELVLPIEATKIGDVNRDGIVDVSDVTALVDIILGKDPNNVFDHVAANVNGDDTIDVSDVTALVDIILGKNTQQ